MVVEVELEQRARWGCGGEGKREQNESLFLCLWEVAFLVQFSKMLTLCRFMSKWYPNKSHSWRNHLDGSKARSLDLSLEVTSSSSHQSSCRWQQYPGSCWCCFPDCPSALTLFPSQPPYSAELKVSWNLRKGCLPLPQTGKKTLIPVCWQIIIKRYVQRYVIIKRWAIKIIKRYVKIKIHIQSLGRYSSLSLFPFTV